MLGLLEGLSVLKMADGLVALVNLRGASLLVRGFLVWGQRPQEGVGDLLHQTGCSQRVLRLSGFWQPLKLCDTYLTSCQLRPGGIYVANVAERLCLL